MAGGVPSESVVSPNPQAARAGSRRTRDKRMRCMLSGSLGQDPEVGNHASVGSPRASVAEKQTLVVRRAVTRDRDTIDTDGGCLVTEDLPQVEVPRPFARGVEAAALHD